MASSSAGDEEDAAADAQARESADAKTMLAMTLMIKWNSAERRQPPRAARAYQGRRIARRAAREQQCGLRQHGSRRRRARGGGASGIGAPASQLQLRARAASDAVGAGGRRRPRCQRESAERELKWEAERGELELQRRAHEESRKAAESGRTDHVQWQWEKRAGAGARRSRGGVTAGMAAANDDDVKTGLEGGFHPRHISQI